MSTVAIQALGVVLDQVVSVGRTVSVNAISTALNTIVVSALTDEKNIAMFDSPAVCTASDMWIWAIGLHLAAAILYDLWAGARLYVVHPDIQPISSATFVLVGVNVIASSFALQSIPFLAAASRFAESCRYAPPDAVCKCKVAREWPSARDELFLYVGSALLCTFATFASILALRSLCLHRGGTVADPGPFRVLTLTKEAHEVHVHIDWTASELPALLEAASDDGCRWSWSVQCCGRLCVCLLERTRGTSTLCCRQCTRQSINRRLQCVLDGLKDGFVADLPLRIEDVIGIRGAEWISGTSPFRRLWQYPIGRIATVAPSHDLLQSRYRIRGTPQQSSVTVAAAGGVSSQAVANQPKKAPNPPGAFGYLLPRSLVIYREINGAENDQVLFRLAAGSLRWSKDSIIVLVVLNVRVGVDSLFIEMFNANDIDSDDGVLMTVGKGSMTCTAVSTTRNRFVREDVLRHVRAHLQGTPSKDVQSPHAQQRGAGGAAATGVSPPP
jgi:hypothetical protein